MGLGTQCIDDQLGNGKWRLAQAELEDLLSLSRAQRSLIATVAERVIPRTSRFSWTSNVKLRIVVTRRSPPVRRGSRSAGGACFPEHAMRSFPCSSVIVRFDISDSTGLLVPEKNGLLRLK